MKLTNLFIRCFVFIYLFLLSPSLMAQDDWQYWNEYHLSYKITDHLSVILNPSIRMKDDVSENQYWESRQGFSYKFSDQWNLNIHYLHSESKNSSNKWIDENAFELQPTYKWKWIGFDFANRLRLVYRIINGSERWLYREQIKIGKKVTVFHQEVTPFVSNEIFYDELLDQFNQNRARVGISKKVSKAMLMTIFYQYKSNSIKKDWVGENILGTGIDLSF